jgi:gamma-glutamyl AIG2-like cyclotransferase
MAQQVRVFFYGLFMDPEALQAQGFRPTEVSRAYVERYALRLGQRATLVPAHEGQVHGTVMRLTHEEVDRLYSEPSVSAYRSEPVLARLPDGSSEPALCFNLPDAPAENAGNPQYAAALRAVARKMGLPDAYVAALSG